MQAEVRMRGHARVVHLLAALLLALPGSLAQAGELLLADWHDGTIRVRRDGDEGLAIVDAATLTTPLGSLWKLFVHAYLLESGVREDEYLCRGGDREEVYCCEPGQRIGRDLALLRSCGRYFEPARLRLDPAAWRRHWSPLSPPPWLADLARLRPETEVPVAELLAVLHRLPSAPELRRILVPAVLVAAPPAVESLGSQLRIKTFSWRDSGGGRIGGFAGWRADGTPIFARASGTSRSLLGQHAATLARAWPAVWPREPTGCVRVAMFARYPLAEVLDRAGRRMDRPGPLRGSYRVRFQRGTEVNIDSDGELWLASLSPPRIEARLETEEYVARVLEREAGPEPDAAARALVIVIRSYLLNHGTPEGDCLAISDSSATQRVSPRPAGAAARKVAAGSAGLVLTGQPVRYHLDADSPGRLGWKTASEAARAGATAGQLLQAAFPRAGLAAWHDPRETCSEFPEAQAWLLAQLPRWRPHLTTLPGHEERPDIGVCRLAAGRPFADRHAMRVHVRSLKSEQDRLDLTHEYLHLAFAHHPLGEDEEAIEALARKLLGLR